MSRPPPDPSSLEVAVPAIDVRSGLVPLGVDDDGAMEVPEDFDLAGWYVHGSRPGEPGPMVVAGHVDSTDGPAVFFDLADLVPGDVVEVGEAGGAPVTYRVDRVEQHPKDALPTFEVFGATPEPTLRLVTCGGEFDADADSYRDNVVAFATLA